MRHAQEAAAEMETSVKKFNNNVDKKFKEKDANEKNKTDDGVNSILTTKEKTRYKNIGIAFFSGAKDSIVAIFKQIDKDRSKSLFKKATAAVSNDVAAIKEQAEEHKTTSKIFAAVALVGGIYFLFKKWFDEKIPPIWEKIKEACENIPAVISALGDTIGKIFDGSGIADSISTFFKDSLTEIKGFLQRMLNFFKDVFKNDGTNIDATPTDELINETGVEKESLSLSTVKERGETKTYQITSDILNGFNKNLDNNLNDIVDKTSLNDSQIKALEKFIESSKNGDIIGSLNELDNMPKELRDTINLQASGLTDVMRKSFMARDDEDDEEDWHDTYSNIETDMLEKSYMLTAQHALSLIKRRQEENAAAEEMKKERETAQNYELLENTNADKIVDVAVVTNLNQFIKDFFTGDKEGTFKHFSSTAIATIGSELSKINLTVKTELTNISNLVKEKLISLINYEKLDRLIDNLIKTQWLLRGLQGTITTEFDTLYDDLTKHSEEKVKNDLKNFITEKFNNAFNGNNTQIFADIIKEEQAQTASLNKQLEELKETKVILNQLLNLSGGDTNQVVPVPVQQNNNDIPTSAVPLGSTAADTSTAVYFSSGMSPYSMA